MLIYIPSMSRATADNIRMGPFLRLPEDWRERTFYVVPHGQGEAYTQLLSTMPEVGGNYTVLETPEGLSGIAETRRWLAEDCRERGHSKALMMDDDVDFLVRKSADNWQLTAQTEDQTRHMLSTIDQLLDTHAMVGISSREGNNRAGVGGPLDDNMVALNTRIMRVFGIRVDDWLAMEHGRVEVMEDFDLTLQLLESGRTNCCLYYWANGQKMTNMPGGCSTYRTHEVQDRSARRLAELHPEGIVRLRTKQNKTDAAGLGTRTEVTIMWKKAAAIGQARHG